MIEKIFVSEVRVRLLKELILSDEEDLHVRELTRRIKTEVNAVRRELDNLESIKLVIRVPRGNKVFYSINRTHTLFPELLGMIGKEYGLGKKLLASYKSLGDVKFVTLRRGYIEGVKSKNKKEVDLLMIGKIDIEKAEKLINEEEERSNTQINFSVFDFDELNFRKERKDPFLMGILLTPKVMIVGSEEELTG
jgi:DNA-binding transcriptional ArsR family regulator